MPAWQPRLQADCAAADPQHSARLMEVMIPSDASGYKYLEHHGYSFLRATNF